MSQYKRIGIDTSKAVFTLHGVDQQDRPVLRINLRRPQLLAFFRKLPPTEIAMEACGSAHHWARELTARGQEVCLVPPQYVKPYVKRGKNDRNDAEAICEAAGRPGMHFVPVKSVTQQAQGMVLKVRETLVGQRTLLVNTLRGHAAEFGVIAAKGLRQIGPLLTAIEQETTIPAEAKDMACLLGRRSSTSTPGSRNSMSNWPPRTKPTRSANVWPRFPALVRSPRSRWRSRLIRRRLNPAAIWPPGPD